MSYGATLAIFWSYPRLPLADAYAILFASPLLVTALAVPLLGERVGWRRWAAVVVGFLGVLVMLWPGADVLGVGALAAMVNAIGNGLALVLIRRGSARDSAEAFAFWGNAVIAAGSALALPWFWVDPTPLDLGLFLLAGSCSGTSFLVLAAAYRQAPTAILAPFNTARCLMPSWWGSSSSATDPTRCRWRSWVLPS